MKVILVIAMGVFVSTVSAYGDLRNDILAANLVGSLTQELSRNNSINWKVGEYQEFEVDAAWGKIGVMKRKVDREEGNAVWIVEEISGMATKTTQTLIDRATGKVLRYYENGQLAEDPTDGLIIENQDNARITVPAGTFDTLHTIGRTRRLPKFETWVNPAATTIDGLLQQRLDDQMLTLTQKLTDSGLRVFDW